MVVLFFVGILLGLCLLAWVLTRAGFWFFAKLDSLFDKKKAQG